MAIAPSIELADSPESEVSPPRIPHLTIPDHAAALARNKALSPTNSEFDQASLREIESALARHQSQRSTARANLVTSRYSTKQPDIEEDITAAATPGDDEDYDYRLDTTDHHLDPEESELERTYGRGQQGRRFFGNAGGQSSNLSSAASSIMGDDDSPAAREGQDLEKQREGQDLEKQQYPPGTMLGPGGPIHPSATGPPPQGLIPEDLDIPENDIHQHMHVYVDPGETDGMPSIPATNDGNGMHGDFTLSQEASALVRAHRSGKFGQFLKNRKRNVAKGISGTANGVTGVATGVASGVSSGVSAGGQAGRRAKHWFTGTSTAEQDEENMQAFASRYNEKINPSQGIASGMASMGAMGGLAAAGSAGGNLGGGGVLASLLALYDNGQNGQSGASTPASSRPASLAASTDSDSSDDERERERLRKLRKREDKERKVREEKERKAREERERRARKAEHKALQAQEKLKPSRPTSFVGPTTLAAAGTGRATSASSIHSAVTSPVDGGDFFAMQQRSTSQNSYHEKRASESPKLFKAVKRAADRLGIDIEDDRPKAARSAGGVFGALILNTGALSGVATPAASTLVPNAKKPGFTLARYTLEADQQSGTQSPSYSIRNNRLSSLYARSESHLPLDSFDKDSLTFPGDTSSVTIGMHPLTRSMTADDRDMSSTRPAATALPPTSGGLKRPNKPFSLGLGKLGSMPHMGPLTPGGSAFKSASNFFGGRSQPTTPTSAVSDKDSDYFGEKVRAFEEEERRRKEEKRRKKKAKEKKRKQEIFVSLATTTTRLRDPLTDQLVLDRSSNMWPLFWPANSSS